MKRKYNYIIALLVAFSFSIAATAQETTRRFSKSWPVSEVETLEIINKFGEVKISDKGGSQVTIEVVVTIEGSESRAKALLDDITVSFGSLGSKATAETKIASNFKSRGKFSIDYTVNIPASKNLNITNKFGNVVMQNLNGKGIFDIGYGNLTAGQLNTPGSDGFRLNLEYGKADAESMKDARVSLSYSKMFVKSAENVVLESKYSTLDIDKLKALRVDSKYDTFNFGSMVSLEGDSKFTNYRIATIEKRLKLVSGYGTVRVDHIPADFELIDVNSSYAQISLGIENNAAYQVYATCDYCSIDYPQSNFVGNRMKENTRQTIDGKISGGTNGKVSVISRYGNIKLVK
jgi:hypothetical protein